MAGEFVPFSSTLNSKLPSGNTAGRAQFVSVSPASASSSTLPNGATPQSHPVTSTAVGHSHRGVTVDFKRDGDRISQIRVQCRCGEVIELDCEY